MLVDLVALAVSLDRDFVELGLGDDGDLGVECDAKKAVTSKGNSYILATYSPFMTTSGD